MKKYIVKNCPAIYDYGKGKCCNDLKFDEHTLCQNCTDCLIKQIVELCGKYHKIEIGKNNPMVAINYLSSDILNLLEIEEVNEE